MLDQWVEDLLLRAKDLDFRFTLMELQDKLVYPGHFHKCITGNHVFKHFNLKCKLPYDVACNNCDDYVGRN